MNKFSYFDDKKSSAKTEKSKKIHVIISGPIILGFLSMAIQLLAKRMAQRSMKFTSVFLFESTEELRGPVSNHKQTNL